MTRGGLCIEGPGRTRSGLQEKHRAISFESKHLASSSGFRLTGFIFVPPSDRVDNQADQRVERVHDQLIEEEPDDDGLLPDGHVLPKAEGAEDGRVVNEEGECRKSDEEVDLSDRHELGRVGWKTHGSSNQLLCILQAMYMGLPYFQCPSS